MVSKRPIYTIYIYQIHEFSVIRYCRHKAEAHEEEIFQAVSVGSVKAT